MQKKSPWFIFLTFSAPKSSIALKAFLMSKLDYFIGF